MEKNYIFSQRRQIKKNMHILVRKHYGVLAFLTLCVIMLGTEYTFSKTLLGDTWGYFMSDVKDTEPPESTTLLSNSDVWSDILKGNLNEGAQKSERLSEELGKTASDSKVFGRTEGVFASLANGILSGGLAVSLAEAVRGIIHSDTAVAVIFFVLSMLFTVAVYMMFRCVYSAALRRVYLTARVYEKQKIGEIFYFPSVKKWFNASRVMFICSVRKDLWWLTVVGGIIKSHSYFAVPYIVAENPSVSAKEAIGLSCRMMKGHKLELFTFRLSYIGWYLLNLATFGLADIFYGAAFRLAGVTEFYAMVRSEAIEKQIPGCECLNDTYLFEKADKILLYETYFDVVDEITLIHEEDIRLTGVRRIFADWFGIWIGTRENKEKYDELQGRKFAIENLKLSMDGVLYPNWLSPLWKREKAVKKGGFSYLRNYSVQSLFLLFIAFSATGWIWEVSLHLIQTGEFANRGTLFGPWLPIYGAGGIVVLILCSRFRKQFAAEFFTSVVLCGAIEYFTSWYLEKQYNQRWWSYDGYFLNINGRICAEGLLVFGIGCCFVVYVAAPLFDYAVSKLKKRNLNILCIVFAVLFGADLAYSSGHPNMSEGAVQSVPAETAGTQAAEEEETGTQAVTEEAVTQAGTKGQAAD